MATLVLFIAGAAFLIGGAELLVRGAARIAIASGLTPLVVGLTVVAFGTSAPELAVTVGAASSGSADVALGNVVGSNIFNVLFILGVAALIRPLVVEQRLVRLDVPLMIAASVLVLGLGLDGRIGRVDGGLLATGIVVYTVFLVHQGRRSTADASGTRAAPGPRRRVLLDVGSIALGLALLVAGSRWLVEAAVALATSAGVSQLVIGLTIVAAGTSLPEVATSVMATVRGERDIAVGNVVGSCVFNLLAVLGLGGLVAPAGIAVADGAITFDLPVMLAVAVAVLPVVFTGHRIARWEGAVFLAYYLAYATYLVLDAVDHPLVARLGAAMWGFVLPLTVVTLAVSLVRSLRAGRRGVG